MWSRENQETFEKLGDTAFNRILYGETSETRRRSMHVQIRVPSSGYCSWTIFDTPPHYIKRDQPPDREVFLIRVRWWLRTDARRSSETPPESFNPEPTYEIAECQLNIGEYDALIETGRNITIPVVQIAHPHPIIDGSFYGFNGWGVKLDWADNGPVEWKPFVEWIRTLLAFFDRAPDANQ